MLLDTCYPVNIVLSSGINVSGTLYISIYYLFLISEIFVFNFLLFGSVYFVFIAPRYYNDKSIWLTNSSLLFIPF